MRLTLKLTGAGRPRAKVYLSENISPPTFTTRGKVVDREHQAAQLASGRMPKVAHRRSRGAQVGVRVSVEKAE